MQLNGATRGTPAQEMSLNELIGRPQPTFTKLKSSYLIALDLPGIDREALEIDVDDNRLIVKGTRALMNQSNIASERPRGKFLRTFSVPGSVDQSKDRSGVQRRRSADYACRSATNKKRRRSR